MEQPDRKKTRAVKVGKLLIGGTAPVSIQSMTNTRPHDYDATLVQIKELAEAGADLVRVAVPDKEAVPVFKKLVQNCPLPLVADIHFDPDLADLALDNGAAKIRINPGNIGGIKRLEALALKAKSCNAAIRIGVNAGSLERRVLNNFKQLKRKPYWGNHFWARGYCVDTVGLDSEKTENMSNIRKSEKRSTNNN